MFPDDHPSGYQDRRPVPISEGSRQKAGRSLARKSPAPIYVIATPTPGSTSGISRLWSRAHGPLQVPPVRLGVDQDHRVDRSTLLSVIQYPLQQKLIPVLIPTQQPTDQAAKVLLLLPPLHTPQEFDSKRYLPLPLAHIPDFLALPQPRQRELKVSDELDLQSQQNGPRRQPPVAGDASLRQQIPCDHQVPGPPQQILRPVIPLGHGSPTDHPPTGHHCIGLRIHDGRGPATGRVLTAAGVRGQGFGRRRLVNLIRRAGLRRLIPLVGDLLRCPHRD